MSTPSLNSKFEKTAQWNDHHVQVTFKVKAASIVEGAGAVAVKALKRVITGRENKVPYHLLKETAELKRLPALNFSADGVAAPANTAMMTQLGCDGVFVGSGIFNLVKKEPKQL
nr:13684_t:CDS:2 [Entrophospora candida]